MVMPDFQEHVDRYLSRVAGLEASPEGDPEAQLVPPVRELLEALEGGVRVVHEVRTGLGRPDMGVKREGLLVGFVELKAPGKGADPERFRDPHDRRQCDNFKDLRLRPADHLRFSPRPEPGHGGEEPL